MQEKLFPNEIGKINPRPIIDEMQESYLDYAMSVIVSRALPDVRDGLKPVHRRILYAMREIGLAHTAKSKKSAAVVGEVLGKYHPHGDASVYDAMVKMAQDFSLRYPLVLGQGNFGSIDGDPPAAMRYTEAKMRAIAEELLADIKKDTVAFQPNYDGTLEEPKVLPGKLPNLILNGTVGIAVGMASSIPPHNLREVCDGIAHLIDHPDIPCEDLMEFVKGPDFPTAGIIYDRKEIKQAYLTGKGKIVMRGKAEIEEEKNGQFQIIISELPYQVNKAQFLERIAELAREKTIDSIKDLRDESTQAGIRVVVELKKDSYPKKVLNQLYKLTSLQDTFYVNMLALIDGIQPKVLTLKMIFEEHIHHRQVVVRRRTQFDLLRAEERAHILDGLMIALSKIDAVIKVIKQSEDRDSAKVNLMKQFGLAEKQCIAILEMRLQNLANLERLKIETELAEKRKLISELTDLLKDEKKILWVIKQELSALKEAYGDERRTKIVAHPVDSFTAEDLIPNEPTMVMVTRDGYIKRLSPDTFRTQLRGGKGVLGLTTKEEDAVEHCFATTTHADLLFFTSTGRVFQLKVYDVPQSSRTAGGQALVNFLQLGSGESVSSLLSAENLANFSSLVMVTRRGVIKKVAREDFANVRQSGIIAIKLRNGDRLQWVRPSSGKDDILLITRDGQSIRFQEELLRNMGRVASGVRGIRLRGNDEVVGMEVVKSEWKEKDTEVVIVTESGYGKRSNISHYKVQGRGGSGIKTVNLTGKTGKLVWGGVADVHHEKELDLLIISIKGQVIRLPFQSISLLRRDTQGVHLMRFKEKDDKVASVTLV
jgi:DNA gyrase subunit A